MTKKIQSILEIRQFLKNNSGTIGLAPSLGNFHAGHQSLFRKSVEENDVTVVCIVLVPALFNDYNDFLNYPRTPEHDLQKVAETDADVLFIPDPQDLFPGPLHYTVVESELSQKMEGLNRPAHFDGVLTVILKLLLMLMPNRLYLGEKDYQQMELLQGMCESFYITTEIVPCPTIRMASGLACSSRNSQLTEEQQIKAALFPRLLKSSFSTLEITQQLQEAGFDVQYVEEYQGRRYGAVMLDKVRLIDNVELV